MGGGDLFYILGPIPTLAWVAQVNEGPPRPPAWWRLEEEWGEEPKLFDILGPVPTLAWVAHVSEESPPCSVAGWRRSGGRSPSFSTS